MSKCTPCTSNLSSCGHVQHNRLMNTHCCKRTLIMTSHLRPCMPSFQCTAAVPRANSHKPHLASRRPYSHQSFCLASASPEHTAHAFCALLPLLIR
jgi:hypothetical protein